MNKKKIAAAIIIACMGTAMIHAQVIEDPFVYPNAKVSALGGSHVALTDDVSVLLNNPAGFQSIEFEMLIAELTLGLAGPIFDMTNALIEASGGVDLSTSPAFLDLLSGLYSRIDIAGPVAFAFVSNGFGIGLFNWGSLEFENRGALTIANSITDTLLLTGGYAFRIQLPAENAIDIGISLKAFMRGTISSSCSMPEFISLLASDPLGIILNGEMLLSIGGGADIGVLYSLADILSVGVVARNVYSPSARLSYNSFDDFMQGSSLPMEMGLVPLDLSAGLKFSPPLGVVGYYITDLVLYLDYTDMLDAVTHPATSRHWLLHFNFGLEFRLLEILSIRGGISEGLFAAGIGLDMGLFTVNAAMFGTEESTEPGVRPVYNMILSLAFKL